MLVNRKELGEILNLHPNTIRRLELQGKIKPTFHFNRVYRYDPDTCISLLAEIGEKPKTLRSLREGRR